MSLVQHVIFLWAGEMEVTREGGRLLDKVGKVSNSIIAVTMDKVIVFSVGVESETGGDDLIKMTGWCWMHWVRGEK